MPSVFSVVVIFCCELVVLFLGMKYGPDILARLFEIFPYLSLDIQCPFQIRPHPNLDIQCPQIRIWVFKVRYLI